jgi:hypothetical protein
MKERAGTVGTTGLAPVLERLLKRNPKLQLHLIGHSFGGRLVTAAAASASLGGNLRSMSLLQAAFSHYGFASDYEPGHSGMFRNVVEERRVNGPIIVSQSINDIPVGVAYAIASKLSNTVGAAIADAEETGESPVVAAGLLDRVKSAATAGLRAIVGGPNDKYGGLGRNGALRLKDAEAKRIDPVHPVGTAYDFSGARVFNVVCDTCIADHGDICGPEIVHAVVQGIAAAPRR